MGKFSCYINEGNIRAEMARNKITYADMAILMGRKRASSFQDLITGRIEPRISAMIAVSNILGKSIDHFFNLLVLDASTKKDKQSA